MDHYQTGRYEAQTDSLEPISEDLQSVKIFQGGMPPDPPPPSLGGTHLHTLLLTYYLSPLQVIVFFNPPSNKTATDSWQVECHYLFIMMNMHVKTLCLENLLIYVWYVMKRSAKIIS